MRAARGEKAAKAARAEAPIHSPHRLPMVSPALQAVRLYRMDLPDHACPWGLRA
jgi:hypothetical protein